MAEPAHSARDHAPFSPSAAERWLACPMAVRYAEQLPPSATSEASDFGTRCHELAETALRGDLDAAVIVERAVAVAKAFDEQWSHIEPTDPYEIVGVVAPYVEYIRARTEDVLGAGGERRLEERVTVVGKDCWGSLDCSLFTPFDTLEIIDLKGGKGKAVDPEENQQLLTYAVGEAIRLDWAFDRVRLTIVQPRRTDGRSPVVSWECTPEDLRKHLKAIKSAIKSAKSVSAEPVAGDHCGWCPAKALCPAQRKQALACLGDDPGEKQILALPDPKALTPEQMSRILQHRKAVEKWFEAVGALALTQPPPGWKIVEGTSKRRWVADAHATLVIEGLDADQFHELKLIGVTEATKLLKAAGREELAETLFEKPPGKPSLATADDKRPALDPLKTLPDLDDDA